MGHEEEVRIERRIAAGDEGGKLFDSTCSWIEGRTGIPGAGPPIIVALAVVVVSLSLCWLLGRARRRPDKLSQKVRLCDLLPLALPTHLLVGCCRGLGPDVCREWVGALTLFRFHGNRWSSQEARCKKSPSASASAGSFSRPKWSRSASSSARRRKTLSD